MIDERILIALGALLIVSAVFAGLHERHYRSRRGEILNVRLKAIDDRLGIVEEILAERRLV